MTTGKRSAGLLLYRHTDHGLQVLLGHMGGPFFARRDAGAWSVPKGEYEPDEPAWDAARREFREELGLEPPDGEAVPLGEVRQTNGKIVTASRPTSTRRPSIPAPSRWSGPRSPDGPRSSRNWTAWSGSPWTGPAR